MAGDRNAGLDGVGEMTIQDVLSIFASLGAGFILAELISQFTTGRGLMDRFLLVFLLVASLASAQEPSYHMRCPGDCGPAALAFVTGVSQDQVERVMDWQHYHNLGGIREDLQDSPAAHKLALLKLGLRYVPRTAADILAGRATPNKTIILIHPDARHPYLAQHWVVLAPLSPRGFVRVHWGDGTIREMPDLAEAMARGKPMCAYEVLPGPAGRATLLNRLWDWIAKQIA